ncbi:tetratricopeptide repeat protein [Mucilaginibacter sp.]|uniref:tetratricopeptide repeat protein n=1 Tax=Mucilaginibacter sp. TaxID=1882438 RepID=UPI0035BC260B
MKIKFLMTGLLGLISATTFAQKGELANAQSNLDKFEAFRTAQPALALPSLNSAKTAIDKAAANEKTATLPQTYALKSAIYAQYALLDTVAATSTPLFNTSAEALKKAKELDTKGEFKKITDNANAVLGNIQLNKGVNEYKAGKFTDAYKSFDFYRNTAPEDTTGIYYTGLAALNAKDYKSAATNYSKLVTTKYSNTERIYGDLTSIYLLNKDTASALKTVTEGLAKFPNNSDMRRNEIAMSLQLGKSKELLERTEAAITANPKNKELYYSAGLVYMINGDNETEKASKTKDVAAKNALLAEKAQNFTKAAEKFKKAIEIDPNYFEANMSMGYVVISPAIEIYNAAAKLPASKQKEYDAQMTKAKAQFEVAKPYLLKAVELNPKSADALNNLLTYYKGKQDAVNIAKLNKQIADLK